MILIDSSCWIHTLRRKGDPAIAGKVLAYMQQGQAAWCPMVRIELWNGVGSEEDRAILRQMEQTIPELNVDDKVWQEATELADRCRRAGKTVPATDLIIAACARRHQVPLEHADRHFDTLAQLPPSKSPGRRPAG